MASLPPVPAVADLCFGLQADPHDQPMLLRAVSLLEAVLEPHELESAAQQIMRDLSRRSRTAMFSPDEFPCTASYPYLALAQVWTLYTALFTHPLIAPLNLADKPAPLLLQTQLYRTLLPVAAIACGEPACQPCLCTVPCFP